MPDTDPTLEQEHRSEATPDAESSGKAAAGPVERSGDETVGARRTAAPLSIGEVLEVLSAEFPDVTISKIRFLESQGLVQPERNTSGYRQFGDADIERLRWILRQQRDHFLPLKVIRRALERGVDVIDAGAGDQPTLWTAVAEAAAQEELGDEKERIARSEAADVRKEAARSRTHPSTRGEPSRRGSGSSLDVPEGKRRRHSTPADVVAALQEDPRGPAATEAAPMDAAEDAQSEVGPSNAATVPDHDSEQAHAGVVHDAVPSGVVPSGGRMRQLGREELLGEARLSEELLDELIEFGLVEPGNVAGEHVFDEVDLAVAVLAARSAELGISARHLRIYKVAAVREAGLLEQVAMPLLKQRNPAAKAKASDAVATLTRTGAELHALFLARELGPHLAP